MEQIPYTLVPQHYLLRSLEMAESLLVELYSLALRDLLIVHHPMQQKICLAQYIGQQMVQKYREKVMLRLPSCMQAQATESVP